MKKMMAVFAVKPYFLSGLLSDILSMTKLQYRGRILNYFTVFFGKEINYLVLYIKLLKDIKIHLPKMTHSLLKGLIYKKHTLISTLYLVRLLLFVN